MPPLEGKAPPQAPARLARILSLAIVTVAFILIASYLFAMFAAPLLLYFTEPGVKAACKTFSSIRLSILAIIEVELPCCFTVAEAFAAFSIIFALSIALSIVLGEQDLKNALKQTFKHPSNLTKNFLLSMPFYTSGLYTAVLTLQGLQEKAGIPTGELPITNPFLDLFLLSYSVIVEEICYRVLPLALPLAIYYLLAGKQNFQLLSTSQKLQAVVASIFTPSTARKKLQLESRETRLDELFLIAFSASIFGLAHYLSGVWAVGKITSATLAGLVFGYLYVKYGIYASLLIHWFFNVYPQVLQMVPTYLYPDLKGIYTALDNAHILLGCYVLVFTATIYTIKKLHPKLLQELNTFIQATPTKTASDQK